jgi:putative endonuclease
MTQRFRLQRSPADAATAHRQQRGRDGERLAARLLRDQGYVIERTNVRFPVGELDIVARQGGVLCFVEVRSASSLQWGGALASITDRKRLRLVRAAQWYLKQLRSLPAECRFDVVAIQWAHDGAPRLELIRGAFDAD